MCLLGFLLLIKSPTIVGDLLFLYCFLSIIKSSPIGDDLLCLYCFFFFFFSENFVHTRFRKVMDER